MVTISAGVTSIGAYAFSGCSSMTEVTIPNSVTSIGETAFSNCSSLTTVTIGDGVASIGKYAFRNCNSLTDVYYAGTEEDWNKISIDGYNDPLINAARHYSLPVTIVESGTCGENLTWTLDSEGTFTISGTGDMANYDSSSSAPWNSSRVSIKTIVIDDGVTSIGKKAFSYCSNLTEVTIPSGVTSIGYGAFNGCHGLESITIPDSVTSIGDSAFTSCGIKSITIGGGITSIGALVFSHCGNLTAITIPDGVTSIGDDAFSDCGSLTAVTIGGSVTSIGEFAFCNCRSLTDVYYKGTEADWNGISIKNENTPLINATRHYILPVTGITLDKSEITLKEGETETLTATVLPENAENKTVTWTSSDENVATVAGGVVTANEPGTAVITVTTDEGGYTASCSVKVTEETNNNEEDTFTFFLTDNYDWGTGYVYAWDSSEKSLTGGWPGTEITSTLTNEYGKQTFAVTVPKETAGVIVNNGNGSQTAEITDFLLIYNGIYMLDTVDGSGHHEIGGYDCDSTDFTGVTLDKSKITIKEGETETFTATVYPGDAENKAVTWTSSNEAVATIDDNGVVTAVSAGTAVITVTTDAGGYTASCTVTVTETKYYVVGPMTEWAANDAYRMTKSTETEGVYVLRGVQLSKNGGFKIIETNSSIQDFETVWHPIEMSNCVVDADGKYDIYFRPNYDGGADWYCNCIYATPNTDVTGVTLDKSEITLKEGETETLTATVLPKNAENKTVTWTSSDEAVATVSDGVVTAVSAGTAVITVTTDEGAYTASCSVNVTEETNNNEEDTFTFFLTDNFGWGTGYVYAWDIYGNSLTGEWPGRLSEAVTNDYGEDEFVVTVPMETAGVIVNNNNGSQTVDITDFRYEGYWMDGGQDDIRHYIVTGWNDRSDPRVVKGVTLDKAEITLKEGETETLAAIISPSSAPNNTVTWASSDEAVATVAGGVVTAVSPGTAVITVTTDEGGYTASCSVKVTPHVESGTCGENLTWTLDSEGTLTISGTGDMANWDYNSSVPWYNSSLLIKTVVIDDGVTSIGFAAFRRCSSLTTITMPDSVTSIGSSAFFDCSSLTDVYYAGTEENWNKISIGSDNAPLIDAKRHYVVASGTCGENLTWTLEVNGKLTISGTGAMANYDSSSSAPWDSASTSIKDVVIDDGITSIGDYAFSGCGNIKSITIPDGVTSIGEYAFSDCSSITNIAIPKNVTSIGNSAFDACVNLTDVYYCGTSEDWDGILMGTDNDCLASAKRHYMPSGSGGAGQGKFSAVLNKIGNNIIVTANVPDIDIKKNIHSAMYSDNGTMLEYMIYPAEYSNNTVHFMFKNVSDLSYIKVFLWGGFESMTPLAESIVLNVAE